MRIFSRNDRNHYQSDEESTCSAAITYQRAGAHTSIYPPWARARLMSTYSWFVRGKHGAELYCNVLQCGVAKRLIRCGSDSIVVVGDEFAAERIFAAAAVDGKLNDKLLCLFQWTIVGLYRLIHCRLSCGMNESDPSMRQLLTSVDVALWLSVI